MYGQVTRLFNNAPDLLEDFKQFLPETASQAKAAERARQVAEENAMLQMRDYASPVMSREAHIGTPNHGRNLPPVGNFAPTPITKDNKKRKPERQGTVDSMAGPSGGRAPFNAPAGKRQKQTHVAAKGTTDQPPVSPSLIPALPAPIPPTTTSVATGDEVNFFDRVKKAISNKGTFNEFLKLCNLFSQDLIDRTTLLYRARAFIGNNTDLMKWFENFLGADAEDIEIQNKPRIPTGRVSLSNCRGLGPSYRLLPKRERQKPCSGRDELCNSVLNDEWASHPTWASEDSGFIAHRKNVHEEGLHRIEEERHDYDYNIEACARTIQLLEPIAQQLRRMSDAEQKQYVLPPGLGGQSETIYKRIIMKIYGREKGHQTIKQLHAEPYAVIPVVLNRLKERLETWKMAQREWEKVWREQTQKMFWKSLDHQAVNNAKGDKRQFQTKSLQSEIATKHEEMRRLEGPQPGTMRKPQLEYAVEDLDMLVDVTWLLVQHAATTTDAEQTKLPGFIKEFVALFFGIDQDVLNAKLLERGGNTSPNEAAEDVMSGSDEPLARGRKPGKTGNLLRTALDRGRNGKGGRKERDDSAASASRASTPDVRSDAGDPEDMALDPAEEHSEAQATKPVARWFEHPSDGNQVINQGLSINPNEPQIRTVFKCWANTHIYCFVKMIMTLYERMCKLKTSEANVAETIRLAEMPKPAIDLGIIDKLPTDFFTNTGPTADYYRQMLAKFDEVIKGDLEFADVEETLRRYYLQTGYPMYAFEKMIMAANRFALQVLNSDGKEKSWEILGLFRRDRIKESITVGMLTDYRKAVERLIKDGDLYRLDWVSKHGVNASSDVSLTLPQDQKNQKVSMYLTRKDDPAYYDNGMSPLDLQNRWRTYIASYEAVDDTDNIPRANLHNPFLPRNVRAAGADPKSTSYPPSPPLQATDGEGSGGPPSTSERMMNRLLAAKNEENLVMRIEVMRYHAKFEPESQESFTEPFPERTGGQDGTRLAQEEKRYRDDVVRDSLVMNHEGMKGLTKEEVERRNEVWSGLVDGREEAAGDSANGHRKGEEMVVDE